MKVLVAGAHGNIGQKVVKTLITNGYDTYAMIRKKEQESEMKELGGKVVLGDLEEDLSKVVSGMDAIIFAAGSGGSTGPEKTVDIDQNGAIRLMETAEEAGVKHFVMLSSLGADKPETGPEGLQHYLEAKHNADNSLVTKDMNFSIIRPGRLSDKPSSGIRAAYKLDDKSGEISREDVAKALVECLKLECTHRRIIEIQGGHLNVQEALMLCK